MLESWRLHAGLRRCLMVLALLVLLAQSLGLAHRFVHPAALGPLSAPVANHAGAADDGTPAPLAGWFGLLGEHKSATDCQLFDQLCLDGLRTLLALPLAFLVPHVWRRLGLSERFALHARFFAARAPPAVLI